MSDERCNIYFSTDERDTEIANLRTELERLRNAVSIGRYTIEALAKHGRCEFDNGVSLIAASDLFRANPYARAESAERKLAMAVEALRPFATLRTTRLMTDGCKYNFRVDSGWIRRVRAALTELEKADDH